MNMETETFLNSGVEFCAVLTQAEAKALAALAAARGWEVYELDGRKMTDKKSLLEHLSLTLAFPAYFGGNWDAAADCLTDIEKSSLVLVYESSVLEKAAPDLLADFRDVMETSARSLHDFRKGALALKTVFVRCC